MSERVLLMSWRIVARRRLSSSICSTLKVVGWLGKAMAYDAPKSASMASQSNRQTGVHLDTATGARTFLSAAIHERQLRCVLVPVCRKHVAADRNVRAPVWWQCQDALDRQGVFDFLLTIRQRSGNQN